MRPCLARWAACIVVAIAFVTGCGSSDGGSKRDQSIPVATNAPDYCRRAATLPDGLRAATGNAASGSASQGDKETIRVAVQQLRGVADSSGVPATLRRQLNGGATLLNKLLIGKRLADREIKGFPVTLQKMGEAVGAACSGT